MRHIFFFVVLFLSASYASAQLWTENFDDENNGDQSGTAAGTIGGTWDVDVDPSGTFSVQDDLFVINNTVTEGTWSSDVIDISSVGYAVIDIGYGSAGLGFSASDYIRFYYRIDGGPEILFANIQGDVWDIDEAQASAIVAGNTLEVIIKAEDNSTFFIFGGRMWIADVTITPADILYSRKSGTWTDVTGGFGGTGTWSTNRSGTPACGCVPLNDIVAVIQNGHTVTLPTSQTAVGGSGTPNLAPGAVDIESGGVLQYNTSGVTLGIQQGLFRVRSGGTVNSSSGAITGEQISFQANVGGATFRVDVGGSATIEDLSLAAAATNFHYLTGSGSLTITDDILMGATDATLTNDRTASFSIGDDFDFNARSSFVNNGAISIGDDILVDSDDASITNNSSLTIGDDLSFNAINGAFANSGTATITGDLTTTNNADDDNVITNNGGATLSVSNINPNDADMDVYNSGTLNQSGNFLNINSTDSNFDNLSTGTWNWTMTSNTLDAELAAAMNLTATGNIFNYGGGGAQNIVATTHHHILLSNSGNKTASGSFAVQGDFDVTGTASFVPGATTVTLNGSVAQAVTPTATGITFSSLTTDNSFGVSPQITLNGNVTVTAVLTMTEGNVNLNGNTFSLTSSAAGALSHPLSSAAGWMYNGSFARARPGSTAINFTTNPAHSFFPLGSAWDWRPFFVGQDNVAATAGTMTVTHTNSTSTSDVNIPDPNPTIITRRHNSYWTPRTTATGGTYILRAGGTNFGTITSNTHIRLATSTGVVGTHAAGSGGPTDWRVNRTAVTRALLNVNNFHVASTNAGSSPLPIELLSFSAQLKNNEVELKWSTASETNNDYFTIERATNLEHFEPIIEEDGKGTSKELNHYKAIDFTPLYGRSYYRLKQTDFDGQYSYSSVQVINYEGPIYATLSAAPNPLKGSPLTIRVEGLKETKFVPVQVLNIHGQKVYERVFEVKTQGTLTEEIPAHLFTSSGLYIIKAGETLYLTRKIVVE
jgi:hypothetical protein